MHRLLIVLCSISIFLFSYATADMISTVPVALQQVYRSLPAWKYVDFDESMQTEQYKKEVAATEYFIGINGDALLNQCRTLYEVNNLSIVEPDAEPRIPKIIHFIWLGSPLPSALKRFVATWMSYHADRDWRFKLWTDADVASLRIPLCNQELYDASPNCGIKSDILRYEILYRYGGVYVDTDFECLRPVDVLHHTYDFYAGLHPLDTQHVQIGMAIIGACPHHPILREAIVSLKAKWHEKTPIPNKTGPGHFSRAFFAQAGKNGLRDIALPASYLYPLGCKDLLLRYDTWRNNGAYAVHHWSKAWMPKTCRRPQFRSIENDAGVQDWNH